jgi:hypothetical protein
VKKPRKKFDGGGSVMDKPSRDVRDPEYRRQLEREQALEASPVGPEDLIGLGLGKRALSATEMALRPNVQNTLVKDVLKGSGKGTYAVRNVFNPAELEDIRRTGYMMPSAKEVASGKNRKWFTLTDTPNKNHLRVRADKVPPNKAVRRKDIERYDPDKDDYVPFKKGGKVSSASSRADGIAQRGKTKGRMV